LREQRFRFRLRQHRGQARRPLRAHQAVEPGEVLSQHLLVEKQQRRQRLILRPAGDVAYRGKIIEKRRQLRLPHVARVPLAVEVDEALDPVHVGLFGPAAVVLAPDRLVHQGQQPGRAICFFDIDWSRSV